MITTKTICTNNDFNCWLETAQNWVVSNPAETFITMTICLASYCYWSVYK